MFPFITSAQIKNHHSRAWQRLTEKSSNISLLSMIFPFLYKHPETRRIISFHLIVWMLQRRGVAGKLSRRGVRADVSLDLSWQRPHIMFPIAFRIFWSTLKFEAFFRDVIARVKLQSSINFLWCEFLFVVITLVREESINNFIREFIYFFIFMLL